MHVEGIRVDVQITLNQNMYPIDFLTELEYDMLRIFEIEFTV